MSTKQLEKFMCKADTSPDVKRAVMDCGADSGCVVTLGKRYGFKFSPASVTRWQREHHAD